MSEAKQKEEKSWGTLLAQWTGLLAGPVAWLLQLQVAYTLVPWACAHDQQGISLHVVTLIALLLCVGGAFVSWREWQRAGREVPGGAEGGAIPRSRFMAVMGLATSAFFLLVILIQGVASFILHPCQP